MAQEQTKQAVAVKDDKEVKPVIEKQTNCLGCGKPLKKVRSYYRDGKFYCTKKCWIKAKAKSKAETKEGSK